MSFEGNVNSFFCIEPSLDGLKMLSKRKKFDKSRFKLINFLGDFPFKNNSFDFISSISVYEHLKDPDSYLQESELYHPYP